MSSFLFSYVCMLRIMIVNLSSQLLWKGGKSSVFWAAAGMSPGLPRVSRIRLWGQAKQRDTFPGSLWLLKLVLHLEKMLPLNTYSLWAEADVDPAHQTRPSARMFVTLRSAAGLVAPGCRGVCSGRAGEAAPLLLTHRVVSASEQAPLLSGTQEGIFVYIFCYL